MGRSHCHGAILRCLRGESPYLPQVSVRASWLSMANGNEKQDGACTLDICSELLPHISSPSTTFPWGEMGDTAEVSQEFYARIQAAESCRSIGLWVLKNPICATGNLGLNILFWIHDRQSILKSLQNFCVLHPLSQWVLKSKARCCLPMFICGKGDSDNSCHIFLKMPFYPL